jgi:hypothetical protein
MKWLMFGACALLLAGCTAATAPSPKSGSPTASSAPSQPDTRVTRQCAEIGDAYSDITSAENGYPDDIDEGGWDALIASAATTLESVDQSGAVGAQVNAMLTWWASAPPPGPSVDPAAARQAEAFRIANQLCRENGSPLVLVSTYGG